MRVAKILMVVLDLSEPFPQVGRTTVWTTQGWRQVFTVSAWYQHRAGNQVLLRLAQVLVGCVESLATGDARQVSNLPAPDVLPH